MRLLAFIAFVVLLAGCRKTKLDGEYSVFVGKWKWVGCTETKTVISNGNSSYTYISADDYPDTYELKFIAKGKVFFYKNNTEELSFRTVIAVFNQLCNAYPNCFMFSINLNNDDDTRIIGELNSDSLSFNCSNTNLPIVDREEGAYRYSYYYEYVKVN